MEFDFCAPATSDAAALAAIVSNGKALVIRSFDPEKPDRKPLWKFPGGRVEWQRGESVYDALLREIPEETGFVIPHLKLRGGKLIVGNSNVKVSHLSSSEIPSKDKPHTQHRFIVEVGNELDILYLDRQTRKEDDIETIESRVFSMDELLILPDFLWWQFEFRAEVQAYLSKPA